jgi:hypothetical protein
MACQNLSEQEKVCEELVKAHLVSSDTQFSSTNKYKHHVIKFISDLRQFGGFLWVLWFSSPTKLTATI